MNESEIKKIEASLGFSLPEFYKSTMLIYPFPTDSFADEFLLPNNSLTIIEYNQPPCEHTDIGQPFVLGSDGGEELYFIDVSSGLSQVFVFDIETGEHNLKAKNWQDYLSIIEADSKNIAQEEKTEKERKSKKRGWEFWK